MEASKTLKRGELLFKEGEPIQNIYVIKSGKMSLFVERSGKKIEIMTAGPSQVLGEQALLNLARAQVSAEAAMETKLIEMPLDAMKAQYVSSTAGMKLMMKSLVDDLRVAQASVRSFKMEQDKSPCPQVFIPKIFSMLNLVARHAGQVVPEKPLERILDWNTLKLYTSRMFLDSPQRMRSLLDLLLKLKLAELKFEKNENGDEELTRIHLFNVQLIEDFMEFYQYNLYKGGRAEVLYPDPLAHRVAKCLLKVTEAAAIDRKGVIRVEWNNVLKDAKAQFNLDVKDTHLNAMEKKGLFVKRQSQDNGPAILSFEPAEFRRVTQFWDFIFEIDKWNEKGSVDINEKPEELKSASSGNSCPQCSGVLAVEHKFCPSCGFKLAA